MTSDETQNSNNNEENSNANNDNNDNTSIPISDMKRSAQILLIREKWEEIKKAMDVSMPMCHQIALLSQANKPKTLAKNKTKLDNSLNAFNALLAQLPADDIHVQTGLRISTKLRQEFTPEQLGAYSLEVRKFTASIVKVKRELMAEYKLVKREEEEQEQEQEQEQ